MTVRDFVKNRGGREGNAVTNLGAIAQSEARLGCFSHVLY